MLTGILFLLLAGAQATGAAAAGDPYNVEDPFAVEAQVPAEDVAPTPTPVEAVAAPSSERLICRSRPRLGTRLVRERVCMTAAQWTLHEANMEQQRRDINDMGAAGCDRNHSGDCIRG